MSYRCAGTCTLIRSPIRANTTLFAMHDTMKMPKSCVSGICANVDIIRPQRCATSSFEAPNSSSAGATYT